MTDTSSDRKQKVAASFNLASVGYDLPAVSFLALTAKRLVELAGVESGETILDVATGTGAAAISISPRVGANGRVIGVDIAQDMLEVAQRNIKTANVTNIELQVGDGENLNFSDNSFDRVICASGIFFFPDMLAGLRDWLRVIKPGGIVAFSSFGESAFNPMREMYANRIETYGVELPKSRGFHRLNTADKCRDLMQEAGIAAIDLHQEQLGYYLRDLDDWWDIILHTGFRHSLSQIEPEKLEQFKVEHLAEVEKLATDKGIWLDVPVFFTLGRKPVK